MAGAGGDAEGGQDKTEEATPRRIEKAREEGQIVMSREVVSFLALGAALIGMVFGLPPLGHELMRGMRGVLENGHQLQVGLVATEMMRLGLLAVLEPHFSCMHDSGLVSLYEGGDDVADVHGVIFGVVSVLLLSVFLGSSLGGQVVVFLS